MKSKWRTFEEARAYVHTLGLKSQADWSAWKKSGARPADIPGTPYGVYKDEGWISWGDWFGTNTAATARLTYRPFAQARAFVRTLGLNNKVEWDAWTKNAAKPTDIPTNPNRTYRDSGWAGWGDWFGTGTIAPSKRQYRPFRDARLFAHALGLNNTAEWRTWAKSDARPQDIPSTPDSTYRNKGWSGYGDWLGTCAIASQNRSYRPFIEARALVHSLGLSSKAEWDTWAQTTARPGDIPLSPANSYKDKGWVSWGDWLGTDYVAHKNRVHRPFEEARAFVQELGLRTANEWRAWVKSAARPSDIPSTPNMVYKDEGWQGLGDWLGTHALAPGQRAYRPFKEARAFVQSLRLKGANEWRDWAKSDARPQDIPATPQQTYKGDGWLGLGDWLGTGRLAYKDRVVRPFEQARAFARTLGLAGEGEWREWVRTNALPSDIPTRPDYKYKHSGWAGWGDWLGTGYISHRNRTYRPFEEARAFARGLGLRSTSEWNEWTKTLARPSDIPTDPNIVYANDGWQSMGDWLGTGNIAATKRAYLPFEEARRYVQSLKLKTQAEWYAWAKSDARPVTIPFAPERVYENMGWRGIGDWLGVVNRWNRNAIVSFLHSLIPILPSLDPAELYAIMRQNGLLASHKSGHNSNRDLLTSIARLAFVSEPGRVAEAIVNDIEALVATNTASNDELKVAPQEFDLDEAAEPIVPPHEQETPALPSLSPSGVLQAVDRLAGLCPGADEEAIEFFIAKAVGKLWRQMLADEGDTDIEALRNYPAGEYATVARARFLSQLEGAYHLPLPSGYHFHVNGQILSPNLMQRLVAYRLKNEKRLGNWSGTGAGKTMAAILASRVVNTHLTVIVGLNNTLDGWQREILNAFPDSVVLIKERGELTLAADNHTYLLLNFEAFQQPASSSMVQRLVHDHRIDMVVLDEVHSVKQRDAIASKRRRVLAGLLTLAAEKNADLHVLGMSATPVVNNLFEAVSLLEMVTGVKYADLGTRPTIPNVIAVHEKLVVHGVRYKPRYEQELLERCVEVPGDASLINTLKTVGKGNLLGIEKALLATKLDTIVAQTQPGTLIYTHYVDDIVPQLRETLAAGGFRVAEFTGDDKTGLERFRRGGADVLIGSSTLGTGVDGLQYVCNRLIIATLPWTSAGYEQLIGRLYRQGSTFARVDVIIPQVVLTNGADKWSWDAQRRDRITYKKTLADATVDGVIPEGVLEPEHVMLARSLDALKAWISRLEQGGALRVIERERLMVPLPEDEKQTAIRAFGDFAHMNARFNTAHSFTTYKRLSGDPSEWYLYHTLYREARKTWPEVPYETFVRWLSARPHLVVGDFGCGEALLAAAVPNKVYSFDHVAINDTVIACNMAHTGLGDGLLDVAIFSLSLMGLDIGDYLKEGHRLLRLDGRLRIAEPASKWAGGKREELLTMLKSVGFQLIGSVEERGQFIYIDALKT